ncbi:MAG: hypothetical protein CGU28_08360 [Candidatus Dactylopiibacterium carminicum]|uniref:Uncharacterized protein n=1 Tax=Candidatus Dactylopiibacterium carminicum TaxID=857335 RepID=A0ABQ7HU34_9RHOO|nr:hypothetical protein [Candidatus Dactylopiibacterium carminicum]KAF7600682.1 hypothetical protein BGI27_00785 [Candidatus Dactylopiibacterium carminicum]PAS96533.1 MAG: hypothetical protein CGU28_08360 [Candidatus Dactylopiibacterium carminicum]PAT00684.1 MAG: hypothetical protein BSR46_00785 [Candidatus Dactylopiibacterium carminicum]
MSPQETSPSIPSGIRLLQRAACILALVLTPFLLALAGKAMQAWQPDLPQHFDAQRQVLFTAQTDGSVRPGAARAGRRRTLPV